MAPAVVADFVALRHEGLHNFGMLLYMATHDKKGTLGSGVLQNLTDRGAVARVGAIVKGEGDDFFGGLHFKESVTKHPRGEVAIGPQGVAKQDD